MKENNELNKDYREKKYEDKNYDERNEYDFYIKYFLHLAIGTKYEDCIEISKQEYKELKKVLKKSTKAMVEVFATYTVGFYQDAETYVIKEVDKDVYYCLFNSQRYEKNKRRNEKNRHLNIFFNQEDFNNIPSYTNLENEVLKIIEDEEIKKFLNNVLSKKQSERFYKNKIENIPLVVIAIQEKSTPDAVRDSVNKAKRKIRNSRELKNFKKN